tara:strand:- start:2679 stop:3413 length:735 start_codon:yes stop_codon:yes gene_type:complete
MSLNLAIDIGNSRTKFGLFQERKLLQSFLLNNEELEKNHQIFEAYPADFYIVSSVNKSAEVQLNLEKFGEKLIHLRPDSKLPILIKYQSPETLGKDRISAVIGASVQFSNQNLLVIDCGTCITYDFLTAKNEYMGGAISPGVQMRLNALNNYTNQLPLLHWDTITKPETIGNTTITSMLSGVINGLIEEINGFISSYQKQFFDLKIVLTGGDANFFEKELKNGIFADPNLVLKGLNEILIHHHL